MPRVLDLTHNEIASFSQFDGILRRYSRNFGEVPDRIRLSKEQFNRALRGYSTTEDIMYEGKSVEMEII